ncbi:hemolysin-type calcium-binding region [Mycolicibacterium fortuitum subsp. acetamidolyticum]|uniref:Hemolysin-type calcium-binding region n=1 Tax=Mycolicibacterium fortuitum subsp. acetamidolyticum TaxID=144550 RepID=A0A100WX89_MYCFO|nr:hemolysin-type calcium-binding region [Mycolicibacterium fortuitum subsp. acetamidolyticum]CRL56943.1 hypothetical protein CPGR_04271 [Mycolicibacterium fortuitum subsp. fortuitum DSM 46621 = ATCC 6841 = JCM 6387]
MALSEPSIPAARTSANASGGSPADPRGDPAVGFGLFGAVCLGAFDVVVNGVTSSGAVATPVVVVLQAAINTTAAAPSAAPTRLAFIRTPLNCVQQ